MQHASVASWFFSSLLIDGIVCLQLDEARVQHLVLLIMVEQPSL